MLAKMEWTNDRIWSTTIPNMTGTRTPIHTAGETYRQVTGTPRTPLQRAEKQNPRLKTHHPTFKARAVVRGCRCHRQTRRLSRWNIFSFRFQRSSHQKIPRSNHTNTLRNGRCLFQFLLRVWAMTLRWSCWCEVWLSCIFFRPSSISFHLINVSTLSSTMGCTCYTMFDVAPPSTQPWGRSSSFCTRTNCRKIWLKTKRSFLRPFGMNFRRRKPYFKSSQRSYQASPVKLGEYRKMHHPFLNSMEECGKRS